MGQLRGRRRREERKEVGKGEEVRWGKERVERDPNFHGGVAALV